MFLIQAVTDSVATGIGTEVGAALGGVVALVLGLVNKVVVDLAKKAVAAFSAAPDVVKSVVALLFAEGITWVSQATGLVLSSDVTALETTLSGLLVWAVSMGWHSLSRVLGLSKPSV